MINHNTRVDRAEASVPCPDCTGLLDWGLGQHDPTCPLGKATRRRALADLAWFNQHQRYEVYSRPPDWCEIAELKTRGVIPPEVSEVRRTVIVRRLAHGLFTRDFDNLGWDE